MDKPIETILERLAETIAWCSPRIDLDDPQGCLRTPTLRPHPLEDGRSAVVESVARARYIALHAPPKRPATDLAGGRLLIYEPDMNMAHGLEESETRGYVDIDNIPPWDTWIGYVVEAKAHYLLSWVPGSFVALVTDGIAVSPEMCFRFLDDTDFDLRDRLRRCGITAAR